MTNETAPLLPYDAIREWVANVFEASGVNRTDADTTAQLLMRTEARGFRTHGLSRVVSYVEKLRSGELDPQAKLDFAYSDNLLTCNANRSLGQVAGVAIVDALCAKAASRAIVSCQLRNTGHLGALGVIALRAAEQGFIALLLQATPPVMAMPGSRSSTMGNNPFALAAPRTGGPPLVVDMACSVAARGNILLAARTGEPIPDHWALDAEGKPTTDAKDALEGMLLPFGGHKGFAVAMIVETLAASLTGSVIVASGPLGMQNAKASNALLLIFNPELYAGRESYDLHMRQWTEHVRQAGAPDQLIPGERAHLAEQVARKQGVAVSATIRRELAELGKQLGLRSSVLGLE